MTTRLVTTDIWKKITGRAKKAKQAHVAVAYFAKGAAKRLPLPKGSLLVVDFSMKAIKSGQTCPDEIGKVLRRGVEVHSVENLHAKVFALGKWALVGSTNVSASSEERLVEALIETNESNTIGSAIAFVKSLRGDPIGPTHAKKMQKHYRPPKGGVGGGGKGKGGQLPGRPTGKQSDIWLVPLVMEDWDDEEHEAADAARPAAVKKLSNRSKFLLDEFSWDDDGDVFYRDLRPGHRIVKVAEESSETVFVEPPGKVVAIKRYGPASKRRCIVFVESPKKVRRKRRETVLDRLGSLGEPITKLKRAARRLKDPATIYALGKLWPNVG